jgi:hypothetical protein
MPLRKSTGSTQTDRRMWRVTVEAST